MPKRARSSKSTRTNKRARSKPMRSNKRKRSSTFSSANKRIKRIERMIETKEYCRRSGVNIGIPHNNILLVLDRDSGAALNPFASQRGVDDVMGIGGNHIGDMISVKGVMLRGFFENALGRARVYYRVMIIKCAKGDVPTRTTLFKGDADNKMIDQLNTERYSVVAQKIFNISASNAAPASVIPSAVGIPTASTPAGIATRTFKMWLPGAKFGRGGNLQYENGSADQIKFYDFRLVILCYDWYGTPQDINDVGKINDLYFKVYFKDA